MTVEVTARNGKAESTASAAKAKELFMKVGGRELAPVPSGGAVPELRLPFLQGVEQRRAMGTRFLELDLQPSDQRMVVPMFGTRPSSVEGWRFVGHTGRLLREARVSSDRHAPPDGS